MLILLNIYNISILHEKMNSQNNIFAAYGGAPRSRIGIDVAAALELPFRVDEPMPLAVALPVVVDLLDVRVVAERVDIARGEVFIDSRRAYRVPGCIFRRPQAYTARRPPERIRGKGLPAQKRNDSAAETRVCTRYDGTDDTRKRR